MSARSDVLLWANRVLARKGALPHVLLEIHEQSTPEQVQEAFHKVARTAHPDLHRNGLTPDELELVTSAYSTVAGAYQQMRSAVMHTVRMKPLRLDELPGRAPAVTPPAGARTVAPTPPGGARTAAPTPPAGTRTAQPRASTDGGPPKPATGSPSPSQVSVTPSGAAPTQNASQAMSPKALLYYRKAELCLKRGDLKGAILQLKLACATDPASAFLRTALAEVETEVRKGP